MNANARSQARSKIILARRGAAGLGIVAALALGGAAGLGVGAAAAPTVDRAQAQLADAVLGVWTGTLTGDPSLPPEGAPFTMTLELDQQGAITGTFEAGEFFLDVEDAFYSEQESSFTCKLVTWIEGEEVSADLIGAVQNVDMEGSISAEGFAADFTASKE